MENNFSPLKKVILPGLLILLAGTEGVYMALLFSASLIFIALAVRIIAVSSEKLFSEETGWIFLWGVGFSLANFLFIVLPGFFPQLSGHMNFYFLLIGVTPLVYTNCKTENRAVFIKDNVLFLTLMIFTATGRELLGAGTIGGYILISTEPLTIMTQPAGAFLMVALSGIMLETLAGYFNLFRPNKSACATKKNKGDEEHE
ncbi:MAG: hypothetical protein ACLFN5_05805 [bacterium]